MSPHFADLDSEIVDLIKSNDLIKVNFERECFEFYSPGIEKPITTMSFMTPAQIISQAVRDACK
jgi:hypothetical protein